MATSSVVATLTSGYGFSSSGVVAEILARGGCGARLVELTLCGTAGTAGMFFLHRSTVVGVSPVQSTRVDFQREGTNQPPSNATIYTQWVRPPDVPNIATFTNQSLFSAIRRTAVGATAGPTTIWTFPRGLVFSSTSSLAVSVYNSTPPYSLWISAVIEE